MASINRRLYIGVTNNLAKRIWQHRNGTGSQFCKKYNIVKLVYSEPYDQIISAINREKELKGWKREKKITLIENINPYWKDLVQ